MQKKLFILSIFIICFFNNASAGTVKLNEKLSPVANPILTPEEIITEMPYVRAFMGMNVVPMLVWNAEGGLVAVNDAFLNMIGYTRDEMRSGKIDWVTITPDNYRSLDQNCINEIKTKEYCTPYVKEYVRKDGTRIAVKLWNARNMAKNGQNVAIILPLKIRLTEQ